MESEIFQIFLKTLQQQEDLFLIIILILMYNIPKNLELLHIIN